MKIRITKPEDSTAIAALHAASWGSAYRGVLSDDYLDGDVASERISFWKQRFHNPKANQYIIVAEDEGVVMGFACAYVNEDAQWGFMLDNLHVLPTRKGRGIGSKLIGDVASWCSGICPGAGLFLFVLERNVLARHFYERLGGVVVGNMIWIAPDGTAVTELRYAWENADSLIQHKKAHSDCD
jgi:GNAT superfamily N-acetyltransferase